MNSKKRRLSTVLQGNVENENENMRRLVTTGICFITCINGRNETNKK